MAQRRFWNAQLATCGGEAATVCDLHEIEEVVQIEHARTLSSNLPDAEFHFWRFLSARSTARSCASLPNRIELRSCHGGLPRLPIKGESHAQYSQHLPAAHVGER